MSSTDLIPGPFPMKEGELEAEWARQFQAWYVAGEDSSLALRMTGSGSGRADSAGRGFGGAEAPRVLVWNDGISADRAVRHSGAA